MEPLMPIAMAVGSTGGIQPRDTVAESRKLEKAAQDFEGIFLGILLKSMRGTVESGGLFKEGTDSQIYRDMFDQEIARGLAKGGGIGLAKIIVQSQERLRDAKASSSPSSSVLENGK